MKVAIFSVLFIIFFAPSKCSETHKIDRNPPETVGEAYVESWVSNEHPDASGFILSIPINSKDLNEIALDSVLFRNQYAKLSKESHVSGVTYKAHFITSHNGDNDIILSSDPMEEMKNKTPILPIKHAVELKATEAIVSYLFKGKTRYFKIGNITDQTFQ